MRMIFDRRRNPDAAVVQIDELAQVGYVLRGLILYAGNIVVVDEKLRGIWLVGIELDHIDHRAVDETSDAIEKLTPFPLVVFGRLLAPRREMQRGQADKNNCAAGDNIET